MNVKSDLRRLLPVICVIALTGCQPNEEVNVQRISKNESGYQSLRDPLSVATNNGASTEIRALTPEEMTDRMLVAIYPLETAMWFFKINGSIDQLKMLEDELLAFFKKVEFKNGAPSWELPPNWSEGESRPMRFATLMLGDQDSPLELAISNLPAPQDLTLNVNRWRDQMGLPAIDKSANEKDLTPLDAEVDEASLFDVIGKFGGGMMLGNRRTPPFAAGEMTNPLNRVNPPPTVYGNLQTKPPAGWESGPTSGMVPVRYQKSVDSRTAQITIIPLPAEANEWEPNVIRWAGEVDLLDLSKEELKTRTSTIEIDGLSGNLIRLVSDDESKSRATIAGMIKQEETAWFIKLSGDKQIVKESENQFREFLNTIEFPSTR